MAEKNGEKVSLRWMTAILATILLGLMGWLGRDVLYGQIAEHNTEIMRLQSCKLDTTRYEAERVYTDNQITKMRKELKDEMDRNREERRQDIKEINHKLDRIIERVK